MSNKDLLVSDIGEKNLIKRIIEKTRSFEDYNKTFGRVQYIGDDAGLVDYNKSSDEDSYLVATSDLLIQKYHFPKQMSYFQMGWKAVTVNVSDLAAMGSNPTGILISLAIPPNLKLTFFNEIIDGILNACCYYKIPLIGGDTNQADEIIISGSAFGNVKKEKAIKKIGFKQGDLIGITDEVGLAALGFEILKDENIKSIKEGLKNGKISQRTVDLAIEKALQPIAKINEGKILKQFASSATDITDGLASELYELFNANKECNKDNCLGIMIYEDSIKNEGIFKEIHDISKIINKDPLELILHIGEDFELLFTFNENAIDNFNNLNNFISINNSNNIDNISNINVINDINEINEINSSNNIENNCNYNDFIVIGEVNESNKVEITLSDGKIKELSSKGYEHLT